jgi:hypothetical protein
LEEIGLYDSEDVTIYILDPRLREEGRISVYAARQLWREVGTDIR